MKLSSHKELEVLDYSTAIETLRQKLDAGFNNTYKNIRKDLIRIDEHTKWKDIVYFITQLLLDINQLNNILYKYANTEDLQFRKLLCIAASNISDIVKYFKKLEKVLNNHNYTSELFREILNLKELNTFNILLAQMIEYIEENRFDSKIILEFLTNTVMSNSAIVRGSTVKTLIYNFPAKSVPLLREWAGKEISISVARKLWKHLEGSKHGVHHQVLNVLLHKISKYNYNLDLDEIKFLLDWDEELYEFQFPCIQLQLSVEYDDLLNKYPPFINVEKKRGGVYINDWRDYPTTIHYIYLKKSQLSTGGRETSIYNGHISGLILRDVTKIPNTIGFLSKLKFLSIEYSENLTELPKSFKNLKNLRYLYIHETGLSELSDFSHLPRLKYLSLKGIKLNSIPQWVKDKARRYHSLRYIKEGVNKDDAYVLGLLEILIGMPLDNVRKKVIEDTVSYYESFTAASKADIKSKIENEDYIKNEMERYFYDAHGTKFYKINEEGYVIGISLTSYEGSVSIKHIPEDIGNLKHIEELVISTGEQFTLPETIANLASLKTLSLYRNMIESLPESLGNLESLEYLSLSNNDISIIPDSIGELLSLRNLSLDGNNIATLPESISKLRCLQSISLNNNQLVSLPEEIGDLKILELLDFSNNKLESIPESIINLVKLRSISLDKNPLKRLPESLGNLKSLEHLSLISTRIHSLPNSINELSSLKTLRLDENNIAELPESIGDLRNLRTLNLSKNKLESMPKSINNLEKLESLSLFGNPLKTLPVFLLQLKYLKTIYIDEGLFSKIPKEIKEEFEKKRLSENIIYLLRNK